MGWQVDTPTVRAQGQYYVLAVIYFVDLYVLGFVRKFPGQYQNYVKLLSANHFEL